VSGTSFVLEKELESGLFDGEDHSLFALENEVVAIHELVSDKTSYEVCFSDSLGALVQRMLTTKM
jgi:hypothetical protein